MQSLRLTDNRVPFRPPDGRGKSREDTAGEDLEAERLRQAVGEPVRVVLVDDHEIVLEGLRAILERDGHVEVVSCCTDGAGALETIQRLAPDVVLLDLSLPDMSGLDVLKRIDCSKTAVVLFTGTAEQEEIIEALELGARGVILKDVAPRLVVDCVRNVARGEEWLERRSAGRVIQHLRRSIENGGERLRDLTPREIEVAHLASRGIKNREIAETLCLSVSTVKIHLHNIYEKLAVDGRRELMMLLGGGRGRGMENEKWKMENGGEERSHFRVCPPGPHFQSDDAA
ncbi:MAG: response regulator transcription factor [Acidobacteria bacterium]|nr:response regulator transcription factor [Acidobacteriota bacterium]